jgi:hypothetical protein
MKYIQSRILDLIFNLSRNVDLRLLMNSEETILKLLKGLYLLIKAFPAFNDDILVFLKTIKNNLDYVITDMNTNNKVKKSLDRMNYFIESVLLKSYSNKNTMFILMSKDK